MSAFHDFLQHGVYFCLGWSQIPRRLQEQIDDVLDHLPESFDVRVLVIPRIAPWRLVLFFGTMTAVAGWIVAQRADGNEAAWVAGGAILGAAFAFAMLWSYPRMLVLDGEGVRFIYRNCEISCPWSLFAAQGEPIHDGMFLVLPTSADAIDDVELRQHGQVLQSGSGVQWDAFTFLGDTQLKLRNTLQLAPPTLGMLLQELAFATTQVQTVVATAPVGTPATTRPPVSALEAPAHWTKDLNLGVVENGRTITLPVTRLQFPPACCCCDKPTGEQARIGARGRYFFFRTRSFLDFNIPCCRKCRLRETIKAWAGGLIGLGVVLVGAFAIVVAIMGPPAGDWSFHLLLTGLLALLPAVWMMDYGSRCLLRTKATYLRHSECVQLSFRQPGYAQQVSEFHKPSARNV